MAHHAPRASARTPQSHTAQPRTTQNTIPDSQKAVALIGTRLIELRVNRRSEQFAEVLGMARMALTLGAISRADYTDLLEDLNTLLDAGVSHG
ncbi:hypothetical protein [Larsenimonas rhizosphaerae]|uniref:hypothetical protein n=1 Tax=Larsenimonas rhizosphaerae TaxID=2944682 RepID=UPI0020333D88|nr:hypothetical protein [Larsenimonas rhizosphaerae]MCM2131968.1 hypothetical protein [Larsenimonas rhizosphaerae]